jgi:sugar lactone lactonase YvrE
MRANDGAVDSKGRFWVGYMNDPLFKEPVDEGTTGLLRARTRHEMLTRRQAFFSDSTQICLYTEYLRA